MVLCKWVFEYIFLHLSFGEKKWNPSSIGKEGELMTSMNDDVTDAFMHDCILCGLLMYYFCLLDLLAQSIVWPRQLIVNQWPLSE